MGYSLSYIAVKNKSKDEILKHLALQGTGEFEEYFETNNEAYGADLRNGWFLVVANGFESELFEDPILMQLSQGAEVLTCMVEEHCMHSVATGWTSGKKIWSVYHAGDGADSQTNLTIDGKLPVEFEKIKEQMFSEQAESDGVDYMFDIPVELFSKATGFRYDRVQEELGEAPFEILES